MLVFPHATTCSNAALRRCVESSEGAAFRAGVVDLLSCGGMIEWNEVIAA